MVGNGRMGVVVSLIPGEDSEMAGRSAVAGRSDWRISSDNEDCVVEAAADTKGNKKELPASVKVAATKKSLRECVGDCCEWGRIEDAGRPWSSNCFPSLFCHASVT